MKTQLVVYMALAISFAAGMAVERARAAAQGEGPRVTGIGGIFFKARDPRALAAWYKQHLGIALDPAGSGENAPAYAMFEWIEKGDTKKEGMTTLAIFPAKSTYFGPGTFMINFRVANLDRVRAELKQAGATVDDKVNEESYGRFGWASDPEGNRIELWEPK